MEKPNPRKTRSTLGLPDRINAELMYQHGAAPDDCPPWMAITSDARAGILPKSNVTSKRKLSEKFEYTPHLIHKISTIEYERLGTETTTRRFVEKEQGAGGSDSFDWRKDCRYALSRLCRCFPPSISFFLLAEWRRQPTPSVSQAKHSSTHKNQANTRGARSATGIIPWRI